jgi:hypothetical protein
MMDRKLLGKESTVGRISGANGTFQLNVEPSTRRTSFVEYLNVAVDPIVLLHVIYDPAKGLQYVSKEVLSGTIGLVFCRLLDHRFELRLWVPLSRIVPFHRDDPRESKGADFRGQSDLIVPHCVPQIG